MTKLNDYLNKKADDKDVYAAIDKTIKDRVPEPESPKPSSIYGSPRSDMFIERKDHDTIIRNRFDFKNLRKQERKLIKSKEVEETGSRLNFVLYLSIIAIGFLFITSQLITEEWVLLPILLIGSMMFLPIGMILGLVFLDPYMRCKVLRKVTKRNWGVVYFVGKGQKLIAKMKNFDNALIWCGHAVWAVTKEHIYQLSKNGDAVVQSGVIDPESVVSLVDTVPVLFLDMDSMQPLSLARDRREGINPLELGPALKAWVDSEKAKALLMRKALDMYLVIVIICAVASAALAYISMNSVMEIQGDFNIIKNELAAIRDTLQTMLSNSTTP